MSTVAAIGADGAIEGFALAGAHVIVADDESAITAAWRSLDDTVDLVILSSQAAQVLDSEIDRRSDRLTVVMP